MRTGLTSIMLWGVAACGGGILDPGAGNDAGRGTGTLEIDGGVRAQPRLFNARQRSDFTTELSVRVSRNDRTVTDATVTVTSATGKTSLTLRLDGHWAGSAPGYDEVYMLDVVSDADTVEGVRVDGPDIHVFTQPRQGETVDPTKPLSIRWDREDMANTAVMHAENTPSIPITDTGSYSLAPGALRSDRLEARTNTVRLTRTNRVVPSGAAAGSTWSVSIDNAIGIVALPQGSPVIGAP